MAENCILPAERRLFTTILDEIGSLGGKVDHIREYLLKIPNCPSPPSGVPIVLETKHKRKPSKFNLFMKECIKNRPKDTIPKEYWHVCIAKYKEQKKKGLT